MTQAEKKFIIVFGVLMALWRMLQVPPVEHALLQFLAVGAVPGTHVLLAPDTVIAALPWVFSVCLLLIFRKELLRSIRRSTVRRTKQTVRSSQPKAAMIAIAKPTRLYFQGNAPELALPDKTLPALYFPSLKPSLRRGGLFIQKTGSLVWLQMLRAGRAVWVMVKMISMRFWRWAEPHIRQFDHWLNTGVHNNRYTAELFEIVEDCWHSIVAWRRRI